jgi:hypothetical protein
MHIRMQGTENANGGREALQNVNLLRCARFGRLRKGELDDVSPRIIEVRV